MLLTCNRTFKPDEMDHDLVAKLVQELPGIFVWALEGKLRLRSQDRFTMPPSSLAAMEDFKACRNSVSLFKRDCILQPASLSLVGQDSKSFRIPSTELYSTCKDYCGVNRYQTFGKEGFGKKLKELGVEQVRIGGKRYYLAKLTNLDEAGLTISNERPAMRTTLKDIYDELEVA